MSSNREKADLLASKFAKISSTENYSETFRKTKRDAESDPRLLENNAEPNEYNGLLNMPFAAHELQTALQQTKNGTSPGEDKIPYEFLKQLPNVGKRVILNMYKRTRSGMCV